MTTIWVRWVNLDTLIRNQRKQHQVLIWDEACVAGAKKEGGGRVGREGGGEGARGRGWEKEKET